MTLHGEDDVRRLVYPQFYTELSLSDVEIAKMIGYVAEPLTREGIEVRDSIISKAIQFADTPSPCEFLVYDGYVLDRKVRVFVYETDIDTRLLGPAAQNRIYVYDGNILGIPACGMERLEYVVKAREKGIATAIGYLEGVASLAAAKVEGAAKTGGKSVEVRVKNAKSPADVNIKVGEVARRYVTSKRKKIEVKGPVFMGVRADLLD